LGAQFIVHMVPEQVGALARTTQASGWQQAAGTQSESVRHEAGGSWSEPAGMLLPPGPTVGGIAEGRPSAGEGCSGCPDWTLCGDGGLADADAGPGSA
jgi:hypothetical protein